MARLANLLIAIGIVLVVVPLGFTLYADYSQTKALDDWKSIVRADATAKGAHPKNGNNPAGYSEAVAKETALSGENIALLDIPALDKQFGILEGTSWTTLAKGPGRLSDSSIIGSAGTTVISGHRTMYGAPFRNLDKLDAGDLLRVYTRRAEYDFKVVKKTVVKPSDMRDVTSAGASRLILSTCEPVYSSKYRLLIICELVEGRPLR